jgi:hypothetical protein
VLSYTIDELTNVTFCRSPRRWARIAALVARQQVVRVPVEVGDAADHGGTGDQVIAPLKQPVHQPGVAGVAHDEPEPRIIVIRARHRPVLRQVVEADNVVAPSE